MKIVILAVIIKKQLSVPCFCISIQIVHDFTHRSSPIIFILYAVVVRSECRGNLGFLDFFVLLFVKNYCKTKNWLHKLVLDFLQPAQGQTYTYNLISIWLNVA